MSKVLMKYYYQFLSKYGCIVAMPILVLSASFVAKVVAPVGKAPSVSNMKSTMANHCNLYHLCSGFFFEAWMITLGHHLNLSSVSSSTCMENVGLFVHSGCEG